MDVVEQRRHHLRPVLRAPWPLCGLLLTGCVAHRASVAPVGPEAVLLHEAGLIGSWSVPIARSGPLPQSLRLTAWRLGDDDRLYRGDLALATPCPWWQRFPVDLLTDLLWPGRITITCQGHLGATDPVTIPLAELERLAHQHGYATTALPGTSAAPATEGSHHAD